MYSFDVLEAKITDMLEEYGYQPRDEFTQAEICRSVIHMFSSEYSVDLCPDESYNINVKYNVPKKSEEYLIHVLRYGWCSFTITMR